MTHTRQRIEELFDAAVEMPREQRSAWLISNCAGDLDLLREVVALLAAHERSGGVLEMSPIRVARELNLDVAEGRRIGPYRIVHELGRGGMGVVYLAAREDGEFQHRVALKLLRGTADAEDLQQRFRAERQILASLQHPHISQLLDGGIADGQMPYLVMEYVEGIPITEYCDKQQLGLAARLRLFLDACSAVHHAHKNLVLHRDLKPGNILVTEKGQVKLLDFGIAKLLNPALSGVRQPITRPEDRLLTPEYASPEQVRGEALSTASDVYSLGVVLYELLCGRPPYRLETRSPQELNELICQREPERPSARLAEQENAQAITEARALGADKLGRALRGDLDAITMMALRKEAAQRYGSAELLALDITRYLDGRPVHAQRGSRRYRAGKYLRRHRVQVGAVALVTLSLLIGGVLTLWQWSVARAERDRAEAALAEVEQALQQSQEITGFVTSLFEANDPARAQGNDLTARELLRRGIRRADQLENQPLVQAAMLDVIGRVQKSLGQFADARTNVERALALRERQLGAQHVDVATSLYNLADVMRMQGLYPESVTRAQRALAIREQALGREHDEVVNSLLQVSLMKVYVGDLNGSVDLIKRAVRANEVRHGPNDPSVGRSLVQLASVYRRTGAYEDAEQALRRAIPLMPDSVIPGDASKAEPIMSLGYVLQDQGKLSEAEQLLRNGVDIRRRALGPESPMTAYAMADLAMVLSLRGQHDQALQVVRQHFDILQRVLGADHPMTALARGAVADALSRAGRAAEAETAYRSAIALSERAFGPEHNVTAAIMSGLSWLYFKETRYDEAEQVMRRAITIRERALGPSVSVIGFMKGHLANILIRKREFAEAETLLQQGLAIEDQNGVRPENSEYQTLLKQFVTLYERWEKPAEADQYRNRLLRGEAGEQRD